MAINNQKIITEIQAVLEANNFDKLDRVRKYQTIKALHDLFGLKMKNLKSKVLEARDERFDIVSGAVRTTAPGKDKYIELHGKEAWERDSKQTVISDYVRGLK